MNLRETSCLQCEHSRQRIWSVISGFIETQDTVWLAYHYFLRAHIPQQEIEIYSGLEGITRVEREEFPQGLFSSRDIIPHFILHLYMSILGKKKQPFFLRDVMTKVGCKFKNCNSLLLAILFFFFIVLMHFVLNMNAPIWKGLFKPKSCAPLGRKSCC